MLHFCHLHGVCALDVNAFIVDLLSTLSNVPNLCKAEYTVDRIYEPGMTADPIS